MKATHRRWHRKAWLVLVPLIIATVVLAITARHGDVSASDSSQSHATHDPRRRDTPSDIPGAQSLPDELPGAGVVP